MSLNDATNLLSILSFPSQNDPYSPSKPQDPVSFSQTPPIIPVTIEGSDEEVLDALIYTGATECYMDGRVSSKFADVTQAHDKPIELQLFNEKPSSSGPLTLYVDLPLMFSTSHESIPTRFNITKLQGANIVLGSRWMAQHCVTLVPAGRKITFDGNDLDANYPSSTELRGVGQGRHSCSTGRTSTNLNNIPISEPKYTFVES